jgi:hypothetical protein
MKRRLLARLERLETLARPVPRVILQYGWLKKLPRDYQGERHLAILRNLRIREGLECIEAEEVISTSAIFGTEEARV